MRDESLLHFHHGDTISVGVHLAPHGSLAPKLIADAVPYLDKEHPGRSVVGFCARHASEIADLTAPPPGEWVRWQFAEWDAWFGRINGVFLVDLARLRVVQYPLYACAPQAVACDFSALPGRLAPVEAGSSPRSGANES